MATAKITKIATQVFVKKQLSTNPNWAKRALVKIFEYQTAEEQAHECTSEYNGVGFTGCDGEILTSFAKQLLRKNFLSEKQMAIVFRKMPKYWSQIIRISDQASLANLVAQSQN